MPTARAPARSTLLTEAIAAITKTFAGLGGLLFLFLVISQFLAHFNYSNLATIAAVRLSDIIESANLGSLPLLIVFIVITAVVNLIIPAAIAKWAILAPIFVPLFLKLNVAPDVVLAAYRVGDSPGNVITPLMAYFGMIVIFAQKYQKEAGVGTVVAMMLPYTASVVCRMDRVPGSLVPAWNSPWRLATDREAGHHVQTVISAMAG